MRCEAPLCWDETGPNSRHGVPSVVPEVVFIARVLPDAVSTTGAKNGKVR